MHFLDDSKAFLDIAIEQGFKFVGYTITSEGMGFFAVDEYRRNRIFAGTW